MLGFSRCPVFPGASFLKIRYLTKIMIKKQFECKKGLFFLPSNETQQE
jgi:hypothetical protein